MQLPINADKLTFTVTGDVTPVLVYGTSDAKKDSQGRPLYRVPVIIGGTGSKYDPSSNVTIPGPVVNTQRGQVKFRNLQISTWTIRGNDGKERSGVTLRAEGVEQVKA